MKQKISVVVPIYNEAEGIQKFLDGELMPALEGMSYDTEVILVDDGSEDGTLEQIEKCKILEKVPVEVVALTRNFGKEVAL